MLNLLVGDTHNFILTSITIIHLTQCKQQLQTQKFPHLLSKSEGTKVTFLQQDAVGGTESRAAAQNTYNYWNIQALEIPLPWI